ncbi:MAG: MFS transporter [Phycisphaerales bacterium JB064]
MSPPLPSPKDVMPLKRASRSVAMRVLWSFLPESVPAMARANYRREALAALFLPFALAATEGAIVSVLVRVAYEGRVDRVLLNLAVGVLAAAPAMANITSFVWVKLSHGARKIPFMNALQIALLVLVVVISASPRNGLGLAMTTLAVVAGRMCWAGLVTIRSTVWRYNYRRDVRAQITGKFATIQVLTLALLGVGLGQAMDLDERAFRIMLPIGAALAGVGVWQYSKIRVRHEASLLAGERKGDATRSVSLNPWAIVRTLREDRPFARFMAAQFMLGLGNMMAMAPLVLVLREQFELGYLAGIMIASSIPLGLMPLFIPLWAKLLDHTHIVRFRTIHSWAFLVNLGLMILGVWLDQLWLVVLAVVVKGAAFAGGVLAWNLGHLDFAPPGRESQYMGVHVTLTGVRGALAPMIGVSIYTIAASSGFAFDEGAWTYGACLLIAGCGTAAFFALAKDPAVRSRIREEPFETAPPSRTSA